MIIYTYKQQVCIKKYHGKFKILGILAVTTQAHEGIETICKTFVNKLLYVTTQAHEGIETNNGWVAEGRNTVTTQAHEGIETTMKSLQLHL